MKETRPPLIIRLIERRYGITPASVLNGEPPSARAGEHIDAELKAAVNDIKAAAFRAENGRGLVDYARLRQSEAYAAYRLCARRLRSFDPAELASQEERLAFWINIYNALLIDAVIAWKVQRSVREAPGFFWRAAYNVNGHRFSAMDIEHGILRANSGHPAIPGPHFSPRDPRLAYSLEKLDPRIHFALVCASSSCPPIAVYDAQRIDEQLDMAALAFVNGGGIALDRRAGIARLSRIFLWYASDFGGSAPFNIRPVLDYALPLIDNRQEREWAASQRDRLKIRYQKYDWSLNGFPTA